MLHRLEHDVDAWIALAGPGAPYLVPGSFLWEGEYLVVATRSRPAATCEPIGSGVGRQAQAGRADDRGRRRGHRGRGRRAQRPRRHVSCGDRFRPAHSAHPYACYWVRPTADSSVAGSPMNSTAASCCATGPDCTERASAGRGNTALRSALTVSTSRSTQAARREQRSAAERPAAWVWVDVPLAYLNQACDHLVTEPCTWMPCRAAGCACGSPAGKATDSRRAGHRVALLANAEPPHEGCGVARTRAGCPDRGGCGDTHAGRTSWTRSARQAGLAAAAGGALVLVLVVVPDYRTWPAGTVSAARRHADRGRHRASPAGAGAGRIHGLGRRRRPARAVPAPCGTC